MSCAYDHDEVVVIRHGDDITWQWIGDSGFAIVQREALENLLTLARDSVAWRRYVLADDENSNASAFRLGVEEGQAQALSAGAATAEALRESYLSGIRVALERVDQAGRAAKQLRDLLDQESSK